MKIKKEIQLTILDKNEERSIFKYSTVNSQSTAKIESKYIENYKKSILE